jgi:hypothetical protein
MIRNYGSLNRFQRRGKGKTAKAWKKSYARKSGNAQGMLGGGGKKKKDKTYRGFP